MAQYRVLLQRACDTLVFAAKRTERLSTIRDSYEKRGEVVVPSTAERGRLSSSALRAEPCDVQRGTGRHHTHLLGRDRRVPVGQFVERVHRLQQLPGSDGAPDGVPGRRP